jgi:hypothetical protein
MCAYRKNFCAALASDHQPDLGIHLLLLLQMLLVKLLATGSAASPHQQVPVVPPRIELVVPRVQRHEVDALEMTRQHLAIFRDVTSGIQVEDLNVGVTGYELHDQLLDDL